MLDCLDFHLAVKVQCILQDLNANLATPRNSDSDVRLAKTTFDATDLVLELESWIDELDAPLPPLKNFILPSGGVAASTLHVARTVCRRAERQIIPLVRDEVASKDCGIYMNRYVARGL